MTHPFKKNKDSPAKSEIDLLLIFVISSLFLYMIYAVFFDLIQVFFGFEDKILRYFMRFSKFNRFYQIPTSDYSESRQIPDAVSILLPSGENFDEAD